MMSIRKVFIAKIFDYVKQGVKSKSLSITSTSDWAQLFSRFNWMKNFKMEKNK